jgi:hypothetical protein
MQPQISAGVAYCMMCNMCNLMHLMAANDICADIAALLNPIPSRTGQDTHPDDDAYNAMAESAWQERESMSEELRLSWQEGGADPLLSTLARLRQQRLRLEADMRLLMAYGRCFTHPRPYKLIDLANAAGLSISGVRIAFDDDEIAQAAEILQRPSAPDAGPAPAATLTPTPPAPVTARAARRSGQGEPAWTCEAFARGATGNATPPALPPCSPRPGSNAATPVIRRGCGPTAAQQARDGTKNPGAPAAHQTGGPAAVPRPPSQPPAAGNDRIHSHSQDGLLPQGYPFA